MEATQKLLLYGCYFGNSNIHFIIFSLCLGLSFHYPGVFHAFKLVECILQDRHFIASITQALGKRI